MPMSSLAAAVAAAEPSVTTAFSVHARAEPGVLPRLLELFAKRGLVPERWHSAVVRPAMRLAIDIEVVGLEAETVAYVANCMRQIAGVEFVAAD
jgi:acetolactate synthase regulatory subunit